MDNVRLILVVTLSFLALLLWEAWHEDYPAVQFPPPVSASTEPPALPAADQPPVAPPVAPPTMPTAAATPAQPAPAHIFVATDVLELAVSTQGGTIDHSALLAYPVHSSTPTLPVELFGIAASKHYVYQGGLAGREDLPNHHMIYSADATEYRLAADADILSVPLRWHGDAGISVEKRLVLTRGSYLVKVQYTITNHSDTPLRVHLYEQLKRNQESSRNGMVYTFTGPVLSTPLKRFEKYDADDLDDTPIDVSTDDAWIGIMQHYFVTALIPTHGAPSQFYSKVLDAENYLVGYIGPPTDVAPGTTIELGSSTYIGPKRHDLLAPIAPGFELTVDFGVLWFIAKPLFLTLQFIHDLSGNWGYAIIILTILLKLLFYPLSAAGYRSMANMRKVQPRMLALRDRYKDDRAQLNQAMMKLYKDEKINPLGGCLPIAIQIPVFIALYWVLLESVEMRQAPFILWIMDLSEKDPYFVLPLLMGITMWFQQKLNPAPLDPVQAKVMQILPFVFTVFFAFFPSGLVLYWLVNNCLSIAQQWQITRASDRAA
jgi:YidC/Oxa1 family membrane protein insertase